MRLFGEIPRFIIETAAIAGLLFVACIIYLQPANRPFLLPILSIFGVAAFRILPSLSRIMGMLALISFGRPSLTLIRAEYQGPNSGSGGLVDSGENASTFSFSSKIEVKSLSFKYEDTTTPVIQNLSFELRKGESLAIVGLSGAGKSTLLDLLLGLIQPTTGEFLVDGKSIAGNEKLWRKNIGYVPQSIFLLDGTIRENVAYGLLVDKQSDAKMWDALNHAALAEFVRGLPQQLDTQIGERGVRLSGGQRQRLGIARALYMEPEIIVLDEATANLDHITEAKIISDVFNIASDLTVIIVSHKPELAQRATLKVNL